MKNSIKAMAAAILLASSCTISFAAEPIVGTWKRTNGTIIKYSSSGGNKYCGKVMSGEYKGKSIGCMSGKGGSYKGKVNKLDEGKTYTGKATATGSSMKLSGCVFGGIICKSETMKRK